MWIFMVKWPPSSPPVFKVRYVARGFSQRQGVDFFQTFSPTLKMTTLRVLLHVAAQCDYELLSLDFSIAFLQGSLHEEIWLRRPPGFTGSFFAGTQWGLRQPVYGLCQAPREWHDTLRTTLVALGFAPSIADPSLFLRTDTTLPPFYVRVYVDDLVFATADTEALAHVKSELQKRHTCTVLVAGPVRSLSAKSFARLKRQPSEFQPHVLGDSGGEVVVGEAGAGVAAAGAAKAGAGAAETGVAHPQQRSSLQPPSLQDSLPPGLQALGLPSPPPDRSLSPPVYGPKFAPPDSSLAVFPRPRLESPPPPPPHTWAACCPPHACPSSPVTDLHTVPFRSRPPRPTQSVLPSPPESSLTASSSTLITNYYRTYCCVLF
ncbi:unnamed protein product [Closterium sp. NIES-54]